MDQFTEAIFQSIDVIVDKKLSQLQYDVTFESEIYNLIDADTGEYQVLYNGEYLSAFAQDPSTQYNIGDRVSILIPSNELSNHKTILGYAEPESLQEKIEGSLALEVVEASPTLDNLYGYDRESTYGVVAGATEEPYSRVEIASYPSGTYHGTFNNYASNYEYLRIQGTFFTTFQSIHTIGNYGLEVTFYTSDDSEISYRLDLSAFNGDPYNLQTATPQSIILKIQKTYLTGLRSIVLFEENFEHYDYFVVDGVPDEDNPNTTNPNIFVKDINIQWVEMRDQGAESYYLGISAVRGTALSSYVTEITLEGKLIFQGMNIYSASKCTCQWYIQDPSIELTSDQYSKPAGVGWRALENEISNTLTLDKTSGETWWQRTYKLVMTYKDDIVLSAEKVVTNIDSPYSCFIEQTNTDNGFQLHVVNSSTDEVLLGDWYVSQPDGSYLHITEGKTAAPVDIGDYLYYTSAIFYCQVYNYTGDVLITNLSYSAITSEFEEDLTISYNGEDVFRYDANGDIPYENSELERHLFPQIAWKDGTYGAGIQLQWYNIDGIPLTPGGSKTSIDLNQKSMIEDIRVDVNGNLFYHIRQKYRNYYTNNTLTLVIKTIDQTYTFKKEIVFVKDGDSGTNGTTYICAIRPRDGDNNKSSEYSPLIYNNGWASSVNLRCFVYKDGERIDITRSDISYQWTGINTSVSSGTGANFLTSGSGQPAAARYVKCQVEVDGVTIYALYPIDTVVNISQDEVSNIDVSELPQFIKYTSSGYNALYQNYELNATYSGNPFTIVSTTTSLLNVTDNRLSPAGKFMFEDDTIAVLRCMYGTRNVYHPIVMYLDTYGNEAINGWDGTSVDIGDGNNNRILAPQVGAGSKDGQNRFSGVVMGVDTAQDKKTGLYGYATGVNTFGLREDGIAYFGRSGYGRVIINGNGSTIYGGACAPTSITSNPQPSSNGMIIRLSNTAETGNTAAIQIGRISDSNYFKIDYNGKLVCQGADVQGEIKAETGYIGGSSGWKITANEISSGNVHLNSSGDPRINVGAQFKVYNNGKVECSNLHASGGYIGSSNSGWKIDGSSIISVSANGTSAGSGVIKGGTIKGAKIEGSSVYSYKYTVNVAEIKPDGTSTPSPIGILGSIGGNDGANNTDNIGISSSTNSIVLQSSKNIRFSVTDALYISTSSIRLQKSSDVTLYNTNSTSTQYTLTLKGGTVNINSSQQTTIDFSNAKEIIFPSGTDGAAKQKNIYARFA